MISEPTDGDGILSRVEAVFPGARMTRRRTHEQHAQLWVELTRHTDARRRGELLAAGALGRLIRRHTRDVP
jgi:hypothetical protein